MKKFPYQKVCFITEPRQKNMTEIPEDRKLFYETWPGLSIHQQDQHLPINCKEGEVTFRTLQKDLQEPTGVKVLDQKIRNTHQGQGSPVYQRAVFSLLSIMVSCSRSGWRSAQKRLAVSNRAYTRPHWGQTNY